MKISTFENFPVNSHQKYIDGKGWVLNDPSQDRYWQTTSVVTNVPGFGRIGRVDHFMKHSIDAIVKACIKQVIKKEGKRGKHIIEIEMNETWDYKNDEEMSYPYSTKKMIIEVHV